LIEALYDQTTENKGLKILRSQRLKVFSNSGVTSETSEES